MVGAKPIEQTQIQTERKEKRKRGSGTIAAVLKETVALSKQHCTTSSSALYQCIHGNWLFCHLQTAIVCADSPLRTENGGPLGAEVAHMQMMRFPTCRLNQPFFFPHGGGGLSCTLSLPGCSLSSSLYTMLMM